ncbi:aminoglycoside 3'-phosphotransferase [Paenibacillus thiaminolyticus]|uniref:aminoglycoside 3'-phosphotransferase n=1 Tax=Paenibacillus thiaminolyticus TaxID=49283 RepID=UPI0035A60B9D
MKRTEIDFDIGTVPSTMRPYVEQATIYDSSCSEAAKTLFVEGAERAFLKICAGGSLERECRMTRFMHGLGLAPNVIAYESDGERDYLLTEAVEGQDGAEAVHLEQPDRLASVFGESLRMLHSLPLNGCPYPHRTAEMLAEAAGKERDPGLVQRLENFAADDVLIHGDYCLPNVILDRFSFRSFIDVGNGGVGDRHFDLYWGLWTLRYNLKTDRYHERFLDAYGRQDVDAGRLADFTKFIEHSG